MGQCWRCRGESHSPAIVSKQPAAKQAAPKTQLSSRHASMRSEHRLRRPTVSPKNSVLAEEQALVVAEEEANLQPALDGASGRAPDPISASAELPAHQSTSWGRLPSHEGPIPSMGTLEIAAMPWGTSANLCKAQRTQPLLKMRVCVAVWQRGMASNSIARWGDTAS